MASGEGVWTLCSVSLGDAPSGGPGGDSGGASANSSAGAAGLSVEMRSTMLDRQSRLDTAALSPGLDSVGEGKVSNASWSPFKPLTPASTELWSRRETKDLLDYKEKEEEGARCSCLLAQTPTCLAPSSQDTSVSGEEERKEYY